jgi:hypothetical protein
MTAIVTVPALILLFVRLLAEPRSPARQPA